MWSLKCFYKGGKTEIKTPLLPMEKLRLRETGHRCYDVTGLKTDSIQASCFLLRG